MILSSSDVGNRFIAPSGSVVVFEAVRGGLYFFYYELDPTEGLALAPAEFHLLTEYDEEAAALFSGRPQLAS